jgi:hypothetical protein
MATLSPPVQIPTPTRGNAEDLEYLGLLGRFVARFCVVTNNGTEPLFTTRMEEIWRVYLESFVLWCRQYHDCRACEAFLRRYGGLVTIDAATGSTRSVFWDPADAATDEDREVLRRLRMYVSVAEVTGVFLTRAPIWGAPRRSDWRHFAIVPPPGATALLDDAERKIAEKAEDHARVMHALTECRPEHLAWAVELLESEALYRLEKVLGPARWLRDLQRAARASSRPG